MHILQVSDGIDYRGAVCYQWPKTFQKQGVELQSYPYTHHINLTTITEDAFSTKRVKCKNMQLKVNSCTKLKTSNQMKQYAYLIMQ